MGLARRTRSRQRFVILDKWEVSLSLILKLLLIAFLSTSVGMASLGGMITGWVVDTANHEPIANASVSVDGVALRTSTDAQGFFALVHVPAGLRSIRAGAEGYVSMVKSGLRVNDGTRMRVGFGLRTHDLAYPRDTLDFDLRMQDVTLLYEPLVPEPVWAGDGGFYTVTGRVLDSASRRPLSGAVVELWSTEFGAVCDEHGAYHIDRVPSGPWTLGASAVGFREKSKSGVRVAGDQKDSVNFMLAPARKDTVFDWTTFEEKRKSRWVTPVEWTKECFGLHEARGLAVLQTEDMGYLAVGQTRARYFDFSLLPGFPYGPTYVVKTGSRGELQWEKTIDSGVATESYGVRQTSDGGYLLACGGPRGAQVIRISEVGEVAWRRSYTAPPKAGPCIAAPTFEDGYIVAVGDSIAKYDSAGRREWAVADSLACGNRRPESGVLLQEGDGSYLVQVCSLGYVRLEHDGRPVARFELRGGEPAVGLSVFRRSDRDYVITGAVAETGGVGSAVLLARVDSQFTLRRKSVIREAMRGECTVETGLGGYLIAGETFSGHASYGNAKVIRVDAQGDVLSVLTVNRLSNARCIRRTVDGGYIVVGTILDSGREHLYIMKIGHEFLRRGTSQLRAG